MLQEDSIYWENLKRENPVSYAKEVLRYQNEEQRKKIERDAEIHAYRTKVVSKIRNNHFEIMDDVLRNDRLAWKYVYLKNNNIYETLLEACETSEQRILWFRLLFENDGLPRDSEKMDCFIMVIQETRDIELMKLLLKYVSPDIKPYSWRDSLREMIHKKDIFGPSNSGIEDIAYATEVRRLFDDSK